MDLIAEIIFLEKSKEVDVRKTGFQQGPNLSLIQEFQLVIVLSEFFSHPGPDATRNAVFLSLFGGNITPGRTSVLVKLISVSISVAIPPLLCAAGTWMQQLGCTSGPSCELVQCLIKDFIIFSKITSEQLKQLPLVAPRFAANFMTTVADLYLNDLKSEVLVAPPDMILELFTEWITDNPSLCLAAQQTLALPTGAIAMPSSTPISGLIRWSVLAPIINQKGIYNRLHLALLETLLQIPSSSGPATALNAQHLAQVVNPLKNHARKLILENIDPESDENYQISLERYAQATQIALASKCIYGNIPQLLCLLETLPNNNLMSIIIKTNKNL
ncbi:integrator complex subunit 15 isoform X2 [Condylostylus longicornis]|nr:integrator complex subunit 15 isoform X2 [Condylostylus longicornis]